MSRFPNILLVLGCLCALASSAQADQPDPVAALVVLFEADGDYFDARESALGDPALDDQVLRSLGNHPDWRVRTQAAILLGWRHDADLFSEVFAASSLPGRKDRRHRFLVEAFSDPAAVPAILERLFHGGERDVVRAGLAHSLVGLYPHWGEDMIGILGAAESSTLAVAAVAALQWSEATAAHTGLRAALIHSEEEVRAMAASVIGWRADGLLLAPELRAVLADHSVETRAKAARALGWLTDSLAADALEALLDDPSADVRLHALRSLHRIAPSQAAGLLRAGRLSGEQDVSVLRVLGRIRSSED